MKTLSKEGLADYEAIDHDLHKYNVWLSIYLSGEHRTDERVRKQMAELYNQTPYIQAVYRSCGDDPTALALYANRAFRNRLKPGDQSHHRGSGESGLDWNDSSSRGHQEPGPLKGRVRPEIQEIAEHFALSMAEGEPSLV